jgi:putative DNA primase/helicase
VKLKFRRASEVVPRVIEWLWPGRIAKGMISVFCGDPGMGKGLVTCDLTAALTTGRDFPDAPNNNAPIDVVMLFCEDGQADTVRPRLEAAGADLERVTFLDSDVSPTELDKDADGKLEEARFLALDKDIRLLRNYLLLNPNTKLIVIDPVTSYLGDASMNKEQEVRRVLGPLAQLAEETGVAVILVMHFNKRNDVSALHRVMGAVANTGVGRATFLFAEDKDNKKSFLFVCAKFNIGPLPDALRYGITTKRLSVGDIPRIEWRGTIEISADQALSPTGDSGKLMEATTWLSGFLTEDKPAAEIYTAAKEVGISERTLKRAKKKLNIESEQTTDEWLWLAPILTGDGSTDLTLAPTGKDSE